MTVYKCDRCGKIIENPYVATMIRFARVKEMNFLGGSITDDKVIPDGIDLCADCYHEIWEIKRNNG